MLAKWLCKAGFEVRWALKRVNRHVWSLDLLRGTVAPGEEDETTRLVISTTLKRCGGDGRKKEIDVAVSGKRVGVAFIFPKGNAGALNFPSGGLPGVRMSGSNRLSTPPGIPQSARNGHSPRSYTGYSTPLA